MEMKVVYKEKIGNYVIIRFIANAAVDSEKTKEKIAPMITSEMTEEDVEKLYMANLVYAAVGPEAELVDVKTGEELQKKFLERGPNQLLLDGGEYIADYRGVEYWLKNRGEWKRETIEEIGVEVPAGAVLQETLSQELKAEIAVQQEEERLAKLTPEQLTSEEEYAIAAALREVAILKGEAEIEEKPFDAKEEFRQRKEKIQAKYRKKKSA